MEDTVIPRSHKESDRVLCAAVSWSSQHRIPRTCKIDKKKSLKAEVEEKCCSELGESLRRKNIKTKNRCHIYDTITYDQSEMSISFTQPPLTRFPKNASSRLSLSFPPCFCLKHPFWISNWSQSGRILMFIWCQVNVRFFHLFNTTFWIVV